MNTIITIENLESLCKKWREFGASKNTEIEFTNEQLVTLFATMFQDYRKIKTDIHIQYVKGEDWDGIKVHFLRSNA